MSLAVQPSAVPASCTPRQASPPTQAPHRVNASRKVWPPASSAPHHPPNGSLMLAPAARSRLVVRQLRPPGEAGTRPQLHTTGMNGSRRHTSHHSGRTPCGLRRLVPSQRERSSPVPPPVPPHSLRSHPARLRTAGASGDHSASRFAAHLVLASGSPSFPGGSAASQAPPVLPPARRSRRLRPSARP